MQIHLMQMSTQLKQFQQLSMQYMMFNFTLNPVMLIKYDFFMRVTNHLARITTPYEKFVKSFGEMAKHMGVFAKNFNVMDPIAITAFNDWTDSMVTISKVDIGQSEGIIGFINKAVDAAFGGGGSNEVLEGKSPQTYTESDKMNQVKSQAAKGKEVAGGSGGGVDEKSNQINTAAITQAITSALRNLTVNSITVNGSIIAEN